MRGIANKALVFAICMSNAYRGMDDRDDFCQLELKENELTEDFTAMLIGMKYLYEKITGDETDIIGFTHILNRLAIQHVMSKIEEKEQTDESRED